MSNYLTIVFILFSIYLWSMLSVRNLVLYFIAYFVVMCFVLMYYQGSWQVPILVYQCVFFIFHFLTDESDVDGRRTQKNS
jgi:hypothetical protein